jgi:hypothetical protein
MEYDLIHLASAITSCLLNGSIHVDVAANSYEQIEPVKSSSQPSRVVSDRTWVHEMIGLTCHNPPGVSDL